MRSIPRTPHIVLLVLLLTPLWLAAYSHVRVLQLSYVEGEVFVTLAERADRIRGLVGQPLGHDAWVETENGRAEIEFEDEVRVRLAEQSRLHLAELGLEESGARVTHLSFERGTASFTADPRKEDSFAVRAAHFRVVVPRKARFRIDLVDGTKRVLVSDGNVKVETKAEAVEVSEGEMLSWNTQSGEYLLAKSPAPDAWDEWVAQREKVIQAKNASGGYPLVGGSLWYPPSYYSLFSVPYFSPFGFYGYCSPYYDPYGWGGWNWWTGWPARYSYFSYGYDYCSRSSRFGHGSVFFVNVSPPRKPSQPPETTQPSAGPLRPFQPQPGEDEGAELPLPFEPGRSERGESPVRLGIPVQSLDGSAEESQIFWRPQPRAGRTAESLSEERGAEGLQVEPASQPSRLQRDAIDSIRLNRRMHSLTEIEGNPEHPLRIVPSRIPGARRQQTPSRQIQPRPSRPPQEEAAPKPPRSVAPRPAARPSAQPARPRPPSPRIRPSRPTRPKVQKRSVSRPPSRPPRSSSRPKPRPPSRPNN